MSRYDDIIDLPHHVSKTRVPMSMIDRGAQFSPFAALTGYEAVIAESARLTDACTELVDEGLNMLDDSLHRILEDLENQPEASFTVFVPDERKSGGKYVTVTGNVRKFDSYDKTLILTDGTEIPLEAVVQIDYAEAHRDTDPLEVCD